MQIGPIFLTELTFGVFFLPNRKRECGVGGKGRQYAQARYHQVKNYKQTSILDQSKDVSRTVKSVSSVNRPAPHLAQVRN